KANADSVGLDYFALLEAICGVPRLQHFVAASAQHAREGAAQRDVVFDQEDGGVFTARFVGCHHELYRLYATALVRLSRQAAVVAADFCMNLHLRVEFTCTGGDDHCRYDDTARSRD